MCIPYPSRSTIGKVCITCFFAWHAYITGIGGITNTLTLPHVDTVRKYSYNPLRWYTKFIDHDHQNWGFFSFVPGNVVRLSFATLNKDTLAFEEIEEYKLTAPPYIGRQNVFNFARSIAEEDKDYRKIRTRFIQWYCKENNISDTTVYLRKKFARLPPESQMEYFDWDSYTMQWNYVQVGEAHCPPL